MRFPLEADMGVGRFGGDGWTLGETGRSNLEGGPVLLAVKACRTQETFVCGLAFFHSNFSNHTVIRGQLLHAPYLILLHFLGIQVGAGAKEV